MGYIDESDLQLPLEPFQLQLHLLSQLQVQGSQGFIQKKHLGLINQGPGNGDSLLLSAGQLGRKSLFKAAQLHQAQHFRHSLFHFLLRHLFDPKAVGHVVENRHVGEQGIGLEHSVDVALIGFLVLHIFPLHQDAAAGNALKAGDHPQRRGLAAAGGTQQRQELALVNLKIQILYHRVVSLVNLIYMSDIHNHFFLFHTLCHTFPDLL